MYVADVKEMCAIMIENQVLPGIDTNVLINAAKHWLD